jgi:hypothetical protein
MDIETLKICSVNTTLMGDRLDHRRCAQEPCKGSLESLKCPQELFEDREKINRHKRHKRLDFHDFI